MGWLSVSGESSAEARFRSYKENFQVEETSSAAELAAVDSSFRLRGKSVLFMYNWIVFNKVLLDSTPLQFFRLTKFVCWQTRGKTYCFYVQLNLFQQGIAWLTPVQFFRLTKFVRWQTRGKTYYAATKVSTAFTICTARHITYLLVHAAAWHAYDTQSIRIHAR